MTLEQFLAIISGQESGGNYNSVNSDSGARGRFQIMPGNWPSWSKEAGIAGQPMTPQNQDRVAAYKMQQYYNQFKDWGAVAAAWYGGPGAAMRYLKNPNDPYLTRKQGGGKYPSILEYVNMTLGHGGQAPRTGGQVTAMGTGTGQPQSVGGYVQSSSSPMQQAFAPSSSSIMQNGLANAMSGMSGSVTIPKFDAEGWRRNLANQLQSIAPTPVPNNQLQSQLMNRMPSYG